MRWIGENNTINTVLYTSGFGQYSVEAEFENDENLLITVYKNGYKIDTSSAVVVAGKDLTVPIVELRVSGGSANAIISGDQVSNFIFSFSFTTIVV